MTADSDAGGGENASNPLAAVNNTDIRVQHFNLGGAELTDYWVDVSQMISPQLKVKFETHVGVDWVVEYGNEAKGIGTGSNELDPFVGVAFAKNKLVLIPLLQQFISYSGPDVSITAARLIAIQALPSDAWLKLDVIVPYDWETYTIPASAELQLGKTISPRFGVYVDLLVGIGSDRPYESGIGVGLRINY